MIFLIPGVLLLIMVLLQWRHRIYALTDQRVIRIEGVRGQTFQDAAFAQIHNLTSESGGLRFDTTPPPSLLGSVAPSRTRVLRWDGLSDVPRVYNFVQEAFAFGLQRSRVQALTQAQIDRISATTVQCAYCGGLIDLATLDLSDARCPQCRAPFALPR